MKPIPGDNRLRAALATALVCAGLLVVLLCARLSFDASAIPNPPRPVTEIMPPEEEFVDFLPEPVHAHPDPAQGRPAEPAADLRDAGRAGDPQPDVVAEAPSPVQRPRVEPQPDPGPSRQQLEEEEARRRVRRNMADAFSGTGPDEPVDRAGNSTAGNGSGQVGGGWIMPKYNKVPSHVTGSVILSATINQQGEATNVRQIGGTAPAAATPALVNACIAEVRSRRFTRADSTPPPAATATITYIFR